MPQPTEQIGGYFFGQGVVAISAASTGALPATSPLTPVTAARFVAWVDAHGSSEIDAVYIKSIDLNDQQIVLNINTSTDALSSGPVRWAFPDSKIQPFFGMDCQIQDVLTVTGYNSEPSTYANDLSGAWQAAVSNVGGGIETATPVGGSKLGTARVVNMGVTVSPGTGTEEFSGQVNTAFPLALTHFCVQSTMEDNRTTILRIDDLDLQTTGSGATASTKGTPNAAFRADCDWFSLKGRVIDKTNTLQWTAYCDSTGATDSIGACFMSYLAA